MQTKQTFAIATIAVASLSAGAALAADVNAVDVSAKAGQASRTQVAQETERALAAGEIKNGPLAEFYTLVEPQPSRLIAQQTLPVRKDTDTRVAAAPVNTKK